MALLKFLRRTDEQRESAAASATPAEQVEQARRQARRRLIGAVILLGIGVIGFPLIFQTQPRPIPVDIAIEIPRRDAAPPLAAPGSPAAMGKAPATASTAAAEPPAELVRAPERATATAPASAPAAPKPTVAVEVEVAPPVTAPAGADGAKAEGVQEKDKEKDKDKGRFIVQAGSYTEAEAVREVRSKLERMGLKTYTQAVVIDGVTRTRVRVGPYTSRQEAVEVQNKVKAAGIQASLLSL